MHHHKQNLQGHWNFCQGNSPFLAKQARAEGAEQAAGPAGQQILKSSALFKSILRDFLKQQLDVVLDLDGFEVPAVALEGHAVGSDEELLEVPGDVVAAHGGPDDVLRVGHQRGGVVVREGQCLLQEGEEWVRVLPVHLALLEHGEVGLVPLARTHVLQREQDLLVGGILLVPELVAGEAEDEQPAGPEAPLQLAELQEVAGGGASERRHVHHQQHLAPQRAEPQRLRRAQRPRRDPLQPLGRHGSSLTDSPTAGPPPRPPAPRPAPPRPAPPRQAAPALPERGGARPGASWRPEPRGLLRSPPGSPAAEPPPSGHRAAGRRPRGPPGPGLGPLLQFLCVFKASDSSARFSGCFFSSLSFPCVFSAWFRQM